MTNNTDDDDAIEVYSDYKAKKMIRFLNSKQEKVEKPALRSEKLVEAMKSNWVELHNTYKTYDPPPAAENTYIKKSYEKSEYLTAKTQEHVYEVYDMRGDSYNGDSSKGSSSSSSSISPKFNESSQISSQNKANLRRAPSLDSLINSSASDSSLEDNNSATHSDSDSGADLKHLFLGKSDTSDAGKRFNEMSDAIHKRHSDICKAEFSEPEYEKDPKKYDKINAEHKHKNSGKKSPTDEHSAYAKSSKEIIRNEAKESQVKEKKNSSAVQNGTRKSSGDLSGSVSSSVSSAVSRKFSNFSTGSSGPMETIIEESTEPKVSVREILARFENLSEKTDAAPVVLQQKTSPSRAISNHPTTNGSLEHRRDVLQTASSPPPGAVSATSASLASLPMVRDRERERERDRDSAGPGAGQTSGPTSLRREDSVDEAPPRDGKHSLLQFAVNHFRQSPELDALKTDTLKGTKPKHDKQEKQHEKEMHQQQLQRGSEWTWKRQTDLVKWQAGPLRGPLLRLQPPELAPLAVECFQCVLRYCGDTPPHQDMAEVKCVYTVLMHCHKNAALRDEVYCQLMKQTTSNKSPNPDSCQRAWRLMSIVAAYFSCSDTLKPYLLEYLTSAAGDRRRHCQGTAAVCLANLRKTARCGGRKNVPSVEEVTAVSAGRSARRQIYRLPGGAERVVNTRCSTVVQDVIHDLCDLIGVSNEAEQAEFSLYCIVQGDAFTMPLAADEYILDVTTELQKAGQPFYLIFCRSVWYHPLRHDMTNPLYTEVLFNQVAPDYLEGLLLELPGGGRPTAGALRDVALVAALLHRAADLNHPPHLKEIKFLLPKPVLGLREIRPARWASLVQADWAVAQPLTTHQAKAQVLAVLSQWPLFGSSFFAVKRVSGGVGVPEWRDHILALNRRGVHFLDVQTHETLQHWPFAEVISTRKVRSEDGSLFLDMKCGSLLQQRVTRLQTEQAHEVSRLVRQYITLQQAGAGQMSDD